MIDEISYILGIESGTGKVAITGGITCADDGEGNITITEDN